MGRLPPVLGLPLMLASSCAPPEFEGFWAGRCQGPADHRVEVDVRQVEDEVRHALVSVTTAPGTEGDRLDLECTSVTQEGHEVQVEECGDHPLELAGQLERGELTDILLGTCAGGGVDGDLELWRIP